MDRVVGLRCRCGQVRGRVLNVSLETTNRTVCYCDDCQAFHHHLGCEDLLDEHGGIDVVQVAPATVAFDGHPQVAGLRLTPKGLHRWYATCCNTPLGNTLKPSIPFVGIGISAFETPASLRDEVFGPARARVQRRFAIGTPPRTSALSGVGMALHIARVLATWKLRGAWPNPFFARTGQPTYPITVLTASERDALRPLCGPSPAAR